MASPPTRLLRSLGPAYMVQRRLGSLGAAHESRMRLWTERMHIAISRRRAPIMAPINSFLRVFSCAGCALALSPTSTMSSTSPRRRSLRAIQLLTKGWSILWECQRGGECQTPIKRAHQTPRSEGKHLTETADRRASDLHRTDRRHQSVAEHRPVHSWLLQRPISSG